MDCDACNPWQAVNVRRLNLPKFASAKIANSLLVTTFSGPLARYLQRWQDRLFHCKMNILPARLIAYLFLAISGLCGSLFADQKFDDLRKAAEQGLASAQNNLGVAYDNGEGVAKDLVEAVKWYGKAAEQGNAKAQFNLGVAYRNGEGVAKDVVEAVKWYGKAAEQGNAPAQFNLGNAYSNGEGVAKDLVEAVKWYGKAAEQGNAKAQFNLGVAYYKGEGVAKNLVEGYAWNHLAAVSDDYAKLQRTNLEKVMSLQQVAAGQKRSAELRTLIKAK